MGDENVQARSPDAAPRALSSAPFRTDWSSVAVTLLLPFVVAAGFAQVALHPEWGETQERWALALLLLLPLEFVRVIVSWALGEAFRDYRSPRHAVGSFLWSLVALAVILLLISLPSLGLGDTFAALGRHETWQIIGPPAAIMTFDGCIALYFFRGDPRLQAARVQAQSDDAQDWFCLAVLGFPPLVLLPGFVVYHQSTHGFQFPAWLAPGEGAFRTLGLLYGSLYFFGKGLLLAQVHGARFQRSGRRVLDARWVRRLLLSDADRRREDAADEARKAGERRAAFAASVAAAGAEPTR